MKTKILIAIAFIAFVALGISSITKTDNKLKLKDIQLKSTTTDLIELNLKYDVLNKKLEKELDSKDHNENKIKELEQEKQKLQDEQKKLQAELQAKAKAKSDAANKVAQAASIASTKAYAATGCNTGNKYKDFIYMKESTCNPAAVNSIGCRGIGQACPGTKLPCGADFACQDAWFTQYAMQRYGSWEAAYSFWIANNWW